MTQKLIAFVIELPSSALTNVPPTNRRGLRQTPSRNPATSEGRRGFR